VFQSTSKGRVWNYKWDFGDGIIEQSDSNHNPDRSIVVAHRYANPGRYQVTLTVYDREGNSNSATHPVQVYEETNPGPPVIVEFTAFEDTTEPSGLTWRFRTSSTNKIGVFEWKINYGDGTEKWERDAIIHTYDNPGTYNVTFTVYARNGRPSINALALA